MDTSEQYIKMCEKTEEIQSLKPNDDIPWSTGIIISNNLNYFNSRIICVVMGEGSKRKLVWLPRQDQLQEMINRSLWEQFTMLRDWALVTPVTRSRYTENIASWEQLWLAFVVKEKYNKVWDGNDWSDAPLR